jgi:hypothetical protein
MWHYRAAGNAILDLEVKKIVRERYEALPHFFFVESHCRSEPPNRSPGKSLRSGVRRQWEKVLQKAAPKIVDCLIEAAESLGERAPLLPAMPANGIVEEVEDESLAAMLLRFLRAPESSGISQPLSACSTAVTFESENPLVE